MPTTNAAYRLKRQPKTNWRIEPAFLYDALCFLNALTGDPFYLTYYKEEYARFEPQLTPAARVALANLKRKIKEEAQGIVSAFLTLYFSATSDQTLEDMLRTLDDSGRMKQALQKTSYYNDEDWKLYESVRDDLRVIAQFLKNIRFDAYWKRQILPGIERRIAEIKADLPKYDVIGEVETRLGFRLPSDTLTVYLLYYSKPHGIRITGLRFLTSADYPFSIVLRNAVHEPMHPPYHRAQDRDLRETLDLLRSDAFLMDKVKNHNPAFGYNSFEGFIEEDCVQALEQTINEKFGIAVEARKRWKESDDGMHVFAVALYSAMKAENFDGTHEKFRDFLIRQIRSGNLNPGSVKAVYEAFYADQK